MTLDAVARLILDEAGDLRGRVLVLDDRGGALTQAVVDAPDGAVRAWCDDIRDADALPVGSGLSSPTDPAVRSAELVLARLPTSLGALEDLCQLAAASASPELRFVAGGRVKHMMTSQNDVLRRYFADVRASRGRDKCRVLEASGRLDVTPTWPRSRHLPALDLTVWAHGRVFNTNRLDAGTALLVDALERSLPRASAGSASGAGRALDLGCGSGIVATWLARRGWATTASDVSWAAVDSTRLTAEANGQRVTVVQRDGLGWAGEASLELIVTNPPFHDGAAKDSTPTLDAIADAGRVLRPGGELWCVFNSHLPYLRTLAESVGPTSIVARDRHYTVTRSVHR